MKKDIYFLYSFLCYLIGALTILYCVGFVSNIGVPKGIDTGVEAPFVGSFLNNVLMITLFGLQHSLMARKTMKQLWGALIPPVLHRSTYVLASSVMLMVVFMQWIPMKYKIWNLAKTPVGTVLLIISLSGWLLALGSTFLKDHFKRYGLRQAYNFFHDQETQEDPLWSMPGLYQYVRHPIAFGLLIAFWFTPTMTVGHLIFTLGMTTYLVVGTTLVDEDLTLKHGEGYKGYKKKVSKLIPFL